MTVIKWNKIHIHNIRLCLIIKNMGIIILIVTRILENKTFNCLYLHTFKFKYHSFY